jgi:hypothetical protein
MKYVVVGQNRDTGARMSMEFEAESKGAAERKATQAGMSVRHVNEVTDPLGGVGGAGGPRPGAAPAGASPARDYRPVRQSDGGGLIRLILLILVVAALVWFFWDRIRTYLPS